MKSELSVLIVDDDVGICRSLQRILKVDGYHIDVRHQRYRSAGP